MRLPNVTRVVTGSLALLALTALPSALGAQESDAMSWLPWTGCWVEVDAPAGAPMTCVIPERGGVAFLTVGASGETDRQVMAGDGVERPVDAGGCVGVEAAEFSSDGARIYTRSRLACDGGTERSTRGMIAMVSPDEWIQVRALTVGDASASWVKRYRLAPSTRVDAAVLAQLREVSRDRATAIEAARMAAAVPPSADDIIEASGRTDAEAVRAWIAEQGSPIGLDADALIRMADAGVSEEIIDVAIAVTYPEKFAVARSPDRRFDDRRDRDRYGYYDTTFGLSFYDPFFYGYNRFDRYSGYGYGRGYGYGYGNRPTVIVVRPAGEDPGPGRVVKGRGYSPPAGATPSGRTARPVDRSSSAGSSQGHSGSKAVVSRGSGNSGSKGTAKKKGGN